MATPAKISIISVLVLTAVAFFAAAILSTLHGSQSERIAQNKKAYEMRQIRELLDTQLYDNDPYQDIIWISNSDPDAQLLGSHERHYIARATLQGLPVAAVIQATADNGYSGQIGLMIGVFADGKLAGVRITHHRETPGLGDQIEYSRSKWLDQFVGRSLFNPPQSQWKVKKDGGEFDQITGATVSPRAVVLAVKNALTYFEAHRTEIFTTPAQSSKQHTTQYSAQPSTQQRVKSSTQLKMKQLAQLLALTLKRYSVKTLRRHSAQTLQRCAPHSLAPASAFTSSQTSLRAQSL